MRLDTPQFGHLSRNRCNDHHNRIIMTTHYIDTYKSLLTDLSRCQTINQFTALDGRVNEFFQCLLQRFMTGQMTQAQVDGYMTPIEIAVLKARQPFYN